MEKAKYLPEEIDRMIDEEISLIDAANTVATPEMEPEKVPRGSSPSRLLSYLRESIKRIIPSKH